MSTKETSGHYTKHANERTRRYHATDLKRQVVLACQQPGASVAGVSLAHGLNANLVRRWMLAPHQTSVQEIAETYAENVPEVRATKQKLHPASSQVQKLLIYRLTSGIRIVANEDLLPTEKRLLQELLRTGKLSVARRAELASESLTPDIHLRKQMAPSRGRKSSSRSD